MDSINACWLCGWIWRTRILSLCRGKYIITLFLVGTLIYLATMPGIDVRSRYLHFKDKSNVTQHLVEKHRLLNHIKFSEKAIPHIKDPSNVTYLRVKQYLIEQHRILNRELDGQQETIQVSANPSVYKQRQETVQHVCPSPNKHRSTFSMGDFLSQSWFVERYKLLYCEVPKVGCTFWKRTLQVLRLHDEQLNTPYELLYEECVHGTREALHSISQEVSKGHSQNEIVSKRYTKFMFTREPFERLFSAYIDKFFSPNGPYWGFAKSVIIPKRRIKKFKGKLPGHDVSFREFIQYVLETKVKYVDPHFKPVHLICDMCNVQFDIIGKMETFKTDVFHIISSVNASRELTFRDLELESTVDTITDLIGKIFQYREAVEMFLDFEDVLRRVWRRLKINNILDHREPFPFKTVDIPFIRMETFTSVVIDLYKSSVNVSRKNKKIAFLQAYRQLSERTLNHLRDLYRLDFELFDYDITGPHLDQIEQSLTSADKEYDYFDIIK